MHASLNMHLTIASLISDEYKAVFKKSIKNKKSEYESLYDYMKHS